MGSFVTNELSVWECFKDETEPAIVLPLAPLAPVESTALFTKEKLNCCKPTLLPAEDAEVVLVLPTGVPSSDDSVPKSGDSTKARTANSALAESNVK